MASPTFSAAPKVRASLSYACPYLRPPCPTRPHPTAYEAASSQSIQLLLLPQRLKLAAEFIEAVDSGREGSGVLLSGPNGVGKSGVGFLSYLLCAARRLPAVYLSRTETWVHAAQRGEGDGFLLFAFWEQNADLIAASEPLRAVFAAALRDEAGALTSHVIDALRRTARRHRLGIGIILDEVQHITAAVLNLSAPAVTQGERTAGSYFRHNWHDWMNENSAFVRISIASAHGERDYKLPSGEGHRLRIVEPLTDGQREALQSHPDSPAFVSDSDARRRIVLYTGNILRPLIEVARGLPARGSGLRAALLKRLERLHGAMQDDCALWLASLPEDDRIMAAERCKELLAGKLSWRTAKGLYDAGIMFRTEDSDTLHPVSVMASSAYLSTTARYILSAASSTPLSSITDGRQRGFALEVRVLARLIAVTDLVGTKLLDGHHSAALSLRVSHSQLFSQLDEVVPCETPVLYQPKTLIYPCDGIIMPAIDDAKGAIIILECSTSSPRIDKRVAKVRGYLQQGGVVSVLAERFPALPRFVALVFDSDLAEQELVGGAAALATADATIGPHLATAGVRVLDRSSLVQLGQIAL